jgi:septal ring factor EnvC (AmiA/AmiB activator)
VGGHTLKIHDGGGVAHTAHLSTDNKRLSTVNKRLRTVNKRLSTVNKRLSTVNKRLSTVNKRLSTVNKRLSTYHVGAHAHHARGHAPLLQYAAQLVVHVRLGDALRQDHRGALAQRVVHRRARPQAAVVPLELGVVVGWGRHERE